MSSRERTILAVAGAAFFEQDGETWFQFTIDGGSMIGPRLATKADKAQYAGEYAAYVRDQSVDSVDDHSGCSAGVVDPEPVNGGGVDGPASDSTPGPRKPGRPRKLR